MNMNVGWPGTNQTQMDNMPKTELLDDAIDDWT